MPIGSVGAANSGSISASSAWNDWSAARRKARRSTPLPTMKKSAVATVTATSIATRSGT